jgi:hypothetical protein
VAKASYIVCDCGRNEVYYFNPITDESGKVTAADFIKLNIPGIEDVNYLVVEDAHLRTRERLSLAQPFTFEALLELEAAAKVKQVEIRLFPQLSTPKARRFADVEEKTDDNDVRSIAAFLERFPHIFDTLKKFKPISLSAFNAQNKAKFSDKDRLSEDINEARNNKYAGDSIREWIDTNATELYHRLDDEARQMLGLKLVYAGTSRERLGAGINYTRLYTLVATLLNRNGSLRLRSDVNKLPFWKFVKEVYFSISPYHMRGGVVASNIKWHFRKSASQFDGGVTTLTEDNYDEFQYARAAFDKKLREIWNVIRGLVVETA